jgi:hypothetical protein
MLLSLTDVRRPRLRFRPLVKSSTLVSGCPNPSARTGFFDIGYCGTLVDRDERVVFERDCTFPFYCGEHLAKNETLFHFGFAPYCRMTMAYAPRPAASNDVAVMR